MTSLLRSLADRLRSREHNVVVNKIDKLDKQQEEISSKLHDIREHLDPLYAMIAEMRETPRGWTKHQDTKEDR